MHVVVRLSDHPLRLFDDVADTTGRVVAQALVGGARDSYYIRELSAHGGSVGAQLRPGAAEAFFGVPADVLAACHTPLDDLWGASVASMRARLTGMPSLERRVALFEAMLTARLRRGAALHPAVALAVEQFAAGAGIQDVVRLSGYSHRTFIGLFRRAVGLTPKRYARVLRLQQALSQAAALDTPPLSHVALAAGYSDQSHFNREFRAMGGVTPGAYRLVAPSLPHHLPDPDPRNASLARR
jgi:AraC-like DNA-binding protein